MKFKLWLALLFLSLALVLQSCSGNDKTISVTKKETVEIPSQIQTQELRKSDIITNPIDTPPPARRFNIVFSGHLSVSEERLYTISSRAELGVAEPLGKNQTQFIEVSSSHNPQSLFAITEENNEKSLGQLNTKTGFLYILIPHVGDAFDLKSQGQSKVGFLKKEKEDRLSLNILFTDDREIKKQVFNPNEVISYAFARESDSLIYTKTTNTKSSIFKMSIEKEKFGELTLLLEKKGTEISHPVIDREENKICFLEKTPQVSQAKCLDLTTLEEITLLEAEAIYEPALSPNDQFLVFWSESREGQKLWLYDFLSQKLEEIAALSAPLRHETNYHENRVNPVWTEDSREIIFGNFNKWYGQIQKYDLLTKKNYVLTDNIFVDFYTPIILGEESL